MTELEEKMDKKLTDLDEKIDRKLTDYQGEIRKEMSEVKIRLVNFFIYFLMIFNKKLLFFFIFAGPSLFLSFLLINHFLEPFLHSFLLRDPEAETGSV